MERGTSLTCRKNLYSLLGKVCLPRWRSHRATSIRWMISSIILEVMARDPQSTTQFWETLKQIFSNYSLTTNDPDKQSDRPQKSDSTKEPFFSLSFGWERGFNRQKIDQKEEGSLNDTLHSQWFRDGLPILFILPTLYMIMQLYREVANDRLFMIQMLQGLDGVDLSFFGPISELGIPTTLKIAYALYQTSWKSRNMAVRILHENATRRCNQHMDLINLRLMHAK